jgi:hypothetical protein
VPEVAITGVVSWQKAASGDWLTYAAAVSRRAGSHAQGIHDTLERGF